MRRHLIALFTRLTVGVLLSLGLSVVPLSSASAVPYVHLGSYPMILTIQATGGSYYLPVKNFSGTIDWGDGSSSSCATCNGTSHVYGSTGDYTIQVGINNGDFLAGIQRDSCTDTPSGGLITAVVSWGDYEINPDFTSLVAAFSHETALTHLPAIFPSYVTNATCMLSNASSYNDPVTSGWDTSGITQMGAMFQGATAFNQPLSTWVTTSAVNMVGMFNSATSFNQSVSQWNTSNVQDFSGMFQAATSFNQPLVVSSSHWNTSSANSMYLMFAHATAFNQDLSSWDTHAVTNMGFMFQGATSFNQSLSTWNTGNVTNMSYMFNDASAFNSSLASSTSHWSTASVTNMEHMFWRAPAFNQDISSWDVSDVTNMKGIFSQASAFNHNISSWDVSHVTSFDQMFDQAYSFNQPIGNWNTGSATTMELMFQNAFAFNQPLNSWNTSNVTNMYGMFSGATDFNQPLASWDVHRVHYMRSMFEYATAFNQPLGNWNIMSLIDADDMLTNSGLSRANYDNLLTGWASSAQSSVPFAATAQYSSAASSARATLVSNGWTINDGGLYVAPTSSPTPSPSSNVTAASLPTTGMNSELLLLTVTSGFGLLLLGLFLRRIRRVEQD